MKYISLKCDSFGSCLKAHVKCSSGDAAVGGQRDDINATWRRPFWSIFRAKVPSDPLRLKGKVVDRRLSYRPMQISCKFVEISSRLPGSR